MKRAVSEGECSASSSKSHQSTSSYNKRGGPGRKSDPRTEKAIQIKIESPHLSLVQCLIAGGFQFHCGDEAALHKSPQQVFDADGISLAQRKNNLNRRLRQMKKRQSEEESPSSSKIPKGDTSKSSQHLVSKKRKSEEEVDSFFLSKWKPYNNTVQPLIQQELKRLPSPADNNTCTAVSSGNNMNPKHLSSIQAGYHPKFDPVITTAQPVFELPKMFSQNFGNFGATTQETNDDDSFFDAIMELPSMKEAAASNNEQETR